MLQLTLGQEEALYVHHASFSLMCWCGHEMFMFLVKAPFFRSCSASFLNGINSQVNKQGQVGCMDSPLTADNTVDQEILKALGMLLETLSASWIMIVI